MRVHVDGSDATAANSDLATCWAARRLTERMSYSTTDADNARPGGRSMSQKSSPIEHGILHNKTSRESDESGPGAALDPIPRRRAMNCSRVSE